MFLGKDKIDDQPLTMITNTSGIDKRFPNVDNFYRRITHPICMSASNDVPNLTHNASMHLLPYVHVDCVHTELSYAGPRPMHLDAKHYSVNCV